MLSASQCRAARALLDWSQPELAERCDIHVQTISNFEKGNSTPSRTTLEKIVHTFEVNSVILIDDEGVKKNKNVITVLEGADANKQFLNNLYHDLRGKKGSEVLLSGVKQLPKGSKERQMIDEHVARLQEEGITERVILCEGDTDFIGPTSWYRWIPEQYFSFAPFQLYDDKLALKNLQQNHIFVIENPVFAKAFRHLFNFVWDHCKTPTGVKKSP